MIQKSILLALVAGAFLAACDDSTSSNGSGGGGNTTTSGTIQAGRDTAVNIVADQTLKFTFVPKAGATYTIKTVGNTDTYLEVRDQSDKTLEVDEYPTSLNGSIVLVTTTSAPVTILLSGSTKTTAGATILSVVMTNGPDDFEDDDRLGTAKELKPDSALQAHTITAGDTDWVKIPVVAGKRYVVSATSPAYTTYLQAFDKDSSSLTSSTSSSITFSSPGAGFVYVRVNFGYTSYTGPYSIRVWSDTANVDKYESDDTRALAKKVVIDSAAQPHRLAAGEHDWVKFDVSADSTYKISITNSTTGSVEFDLYSSLASTSYTNYGSTSSGYTGTLTYAPTTSGTAYLDITGYSTTTAGAYTVSIAKIPNPNGPDAYESDNTLSTAKVLNPDSTLQNRTIHARDVDWVKIPVVAGKRYRVQVASSAYTTYLEAFDADSGSLVPSTIGALSLAATSTGFAYVRISYSSTTSVGSYSIRAWSDTAYMDKYESDDTRALAKNVVVDSAAQLRKLAAGEHDWIKFDVSADSTYRISFNNSANGTIEYDLYSSLSSLSYATYGSASSGYTGTLTYTPTAGGTAYLDLTGYYTTTAGSYTVSVTKVPNPNGPDAYESDNTLSTAKPIVIDAAAQSRTIRPGDVDWIKVPVDSGRTYKIASGSSTYTLYLQVFDADSTQIVATTYSPMIFRAPSTGFVYVQASYYTSSYSGTYTVSAQLQGDLIDSYEPDDTKLTAKVLPTDGTVQKRHLVAAEHDWMKMDLVAGTTYTFQIWNGDDANYTFQCDIQGASSTSVLRNIEAYYENTTGTYTPTTSDTYYIDFRGNSTSSNGDYTISVVAN